MKNTDLKIMRSKIITFLSSSEGYEAERCAIKKHLGIEPITNSETFDRAVISKKLTPIYGSGEFAPGCVCSRPPVVAYRLS